MFCSSFVFLKNILEHRSIGSGLNCLVMTRRKLMFFIVSQKYWLAGCTLLRSKNFPRMTDVVVLHAASSGVNRKDNDVMLKEAGQHGNEDLISKSATVIHVLQIGLW